MSLGLSVPDECERESNIEWQLATGPEILDVVTMHPGQLKVGLDTVRELVDEQFPQWCSLPIDQVAVAGTVNALFRIGEHLGARFPLAPADLETTRRRLETEAGAARELLGRTRFPTPEPVAVGEPAAGYPLPWSVQTWLPGTTASHADPGDSVAFAHDLAEFIRGVVAKKEERHHIGEADFVPASRTMVHIGG